MDRVGNFVAKVAAGTLEAGAKRIGFDALGLTHPDGDRAGHHLDDLDQLQAHQDGLGDLAPKDELESFAYLTAHPRAGVEVALASTLPTTLPSELSGFETTGQIGCASTSLGRAPFVSLIGHNGPPYGSGAPACDRDTPSTFRTLAARLQLAFGGHSRSPRIDRLV